MIFNNEAAAKHMRKRYFPKSHRKLQHMLPHPIPTRVRERNKNKSPALFAECWRNAPTHWTSAFRWRPPRAGRWPDVHDSRTRIMDDGNACGQLPHVSAPFLGWVCGRCVPTKQVSESWWFWQWLNASKMYGHQCRPDQQPPRCLGNCALADVWWEIQQNGGNCLL